jgi:DNA-binding transcriptional ArsR family regulator
MKVLFHPDKSDIQLTSVLYALSDPLRLYVVSEIYKLGECPCGDVHVPIVKSTLSHHSKTLREAGVIRIRPSGTKRLMTIRTEDLEERFPGMLHAILNAYDHSDDKAIVEAEFESKARNAADDEPK